MRLPSNSTQTLDGNFERCAANAGLESVFTACALALGAVETTTPSTSSAMRFLLTYEATVVTAGAGPNSVSTVAALVDPSTIFHWRYALTWPFSVGIKQV